MTNRKSASIIVRKGTICVRIGKIKKWLEVKSDELKKHDIKALIGLVGEEIDRVGEVRKQGVFNLEFSWMKRLDDQGVLR